MQGIAGKVQGSNCYGNSVSDKVTGGGGGGARHFWESPGKSLEIIPQAQKVSGHMREGLGKPREVIGKSKEVQ